MAQEKERWDKQAQEKKAEIEGFLNEWVKESNLEEERIKQDELLANVAVCNPHTLGACSKKEVAFVESMRSKTPVMLEAELKRLEGMHGSTMSDELKVWVVQRSVILSALLNKDEV